MKRLLNYINSDNAGSILDIGTGGGEFVKILASLFPDAKITGIDPDSESIKSASGEYGSGRVQFFVMSAETIDFPSASFNVVTISNALHHLPDRESVVNEMKRVVSPEGYLVISELYSDNLNPAQEVQKLYHHTRSRVDRMLGLYHHETWQRDEIIKMVSGFGLRITGSFDSEKKVNLIGNEQELENWVEKMKQNIERIKHLPEYETFLPLVDEFRAKAQMYGFQPATNVVLICQKQ